MTRPNFLFMIADDHRHSALGALGLEPVLTPAFDKLIADGTCFTEAHIMGSTSGAVCMPSRGMLMSGRNLFDTPDPLPDERAAAAGTCCGQKRLHSFWHGQVAQSPRQLRPLLRSKAAKVFFGGMNDQYAMPVNDFDPAGAYPTEDTYHRRRPRDNRLHRRNDRVSEHARRRR